MIIIIAITTFNLAVIINVNVAFNVDVSDVSDVFDAVDAVDASDANPTKVFWYFFLVMVVNIFLVKIILKAGRLNLL